MTPVAAPPVHHGLVQASFGVDDGGVTMLASLDTRSPLRLAPLQRRADGGLDACVTECGPGMMPGDRFDLSWTLGPGARVRIGSPAHLRVHGRVAADAAQEPVALLRQRAAIADGALLELLPEPVVLHAGAAWASTLDVEISGSGTLVAAEIGACGRIGHGESWAFGSWSAMLDVRLDGRLVAASSQLLQPGGALGDPAAPGVLGGATHWCAMHVVSGRLDPEACESLRRELCVALESHHDVDGCIDLVEAHGVVAIARGDDAWSLSGAVRQLADAARRMVDRVS